MCVYIRKPLFKEKRKERNSLPNFPFCLQIFEFRVSVTLGWMFLNLFARRFFDRVTPYRCLRLRGLLCTTYFCVPSYLLVSRGGINLLTSNIHPSYTSTQSSSLNSQHTSPRHNLYIIPHSKKTHIKVLFSSLPFPLSSPYHLIGQPTPKKKKKNKVAD